MVEGVPTGNMRICKDVKRIQAWVFGRVAGLDTFLVSSNPETLISVFVFIHLHSCFIGLNI